MNNTLNTTAGLFIEESDDEENQDDDIDTATVSSMNTQQLMNNINNTQNTNQDTQDTNITDITDIKSAEYDELDFDDDDDDAQEMSMADIVTMLTISWRNEKLSPDIMEYERDYVERVKEEIDRKEEEIDDMEQDIASNINNIQNKIMSSSIYWYRKEMERIKYILHSYLRIRLWKIQKYTLYLLTDTDAYNNLSAHEQQFAQKYSDLNETHFKNCFLRELPSKYQKVHEEEMCVKPNLNKFVVMKSNVNNDNILIEDGKHHINLQKGNIFVARYKNFKHLVADGRVDLI
eukprot:117990_1